MKSLPWFFAGLHAFLAIIIYSVALSSPGYEEAIRGPILLGLIDLPCTLALWQASLLWQGVSDALHHGLPQALYFLIAGSMWFYVLGRLFTLGYRAE